MRRALVNAAEGGGAGDARTAVALMRRHMTNHIEKENTLVLPLVEQLFSPAEQGEIVGKIVSTIPPADMARSVPWIISRISVDDAAVYVGNLQRAMPPEVFEKAKGWIKGGVDAERLGALASRVPALA